MSNKYIAEIQDELSFQFLNLHEDTEKYYAQKAKERIQDKIELMKRAIFFAEQELYNLNNKYEKNKQTKINN